MTVQLTPTQTIEQPRKGQTAALLEEAADIVKPVVAKQAAALAEHVSERIEASVDGMDESYGKMTLAALWPTLPSPVRLLVGLGMLASVVIAAFLALTIYRQPGTYDLLDVLVVAAMPMVGVVLLTVLPVKTLAYGTLKIGAEMAHRKLAHSEQTCNVSQSTNAAKSAINETPDPAPDKRTAINSEH